MAFIAGGGLWTAEVYSPNGLCFFTPAPIPAVIYSGGIARRNDEIIVCGNYDRSCYVYFISNNTWAFLSTIEAPHVPFTVYNDKLYFSTNGPGYSALDLATRALSTWPSAPYNTRASCQVVWRDAFIRFGGWEFENRILKYNHTTQNWTELALDGPKFFYSGCILLPGDKVLTVGSGFNVYDLISNQWIFNGTLVDPRQEMGVVQLGKRIFVIQGTNPETNVVLEFHPANYSFTNVPYALKNLRTGMVVVSVPARLFKNIQPECLGVS